MLSIAREAELYPHCTHKMPSFRMQFALVDSFLADNSRLQQNYCLCFLAVKAGLGTYSNRY